MLSGLELNEIAVTIFSLNILLAQASARTPVIPRRHQCDQTSRFFAKFLAFYNNEYLPNSVKNCQSWFKILPNTK